jgi:hypothetical protein
MSKGYDIMRNFIIITAFVLLSGCSLFGAKFDNNEYASFIRLETQTLATINKCDTPDDVRASLNSMVNEVGFLYTYTKHLPKNEETHQIVKVLQANIDEMKSRYDKSNPSTAYCKIKLTTLSKSTERALKAITSKVR